MTHIVKGSLQDMAQRGNKSLAESFLSADIVVLIDVSGSMVETDTGRESRYQRACHELVRLQGSHAGKVAVVDFANSPCFCPGGKPRAPHGFTELTKALEFIHIADGCVDQIVVISDGEPTDGEQNALNAAAKFSTPIHTIYIGPEGGTGSAFLRRLAAACRGTNSTNVGAAQLCEKIETLMLGAPA